jgi:hypothetical protein
MNLFWKYKVLFREIGWKLVMNPNFGNIADIN